MIEENIVSFSGGKDSTAMLLRMIELNYPIDKILFADTTLEFPEMYDWINKIEKLIGIKITKTKPKHNFDYWVYGNFTRGKRTDRIRGLPYVCQIGCWWNRESKMLPLKKEMGNNNIIFIGIAADESKRANAKQYKNKPNKYKFPLIDWGWTEQDCINYLKSKNLEHPLQHKFKRTGCWLCPKQSLKSLHNLYKYYPDLWEKLKQYEKDSPQGFKPDIKLNDLEYKWKYQTKIGDE